MDDNVKVILQKSIRERIVQQKGDFFNCVRSDKLGFFGYVGSW